MKILMCGGRRYRESAVIRAYIVSLPDDVHIIHGGCHGADDIVNRVASSMGFKITVYRADWNLHGLKAGPIRNQQMLDEGKPDKVVAFWDGESSGTGDMIRRGKAAGVPVEIVWQAGCGPKQGVLRLMDPEKFLKMAEAAGIPEYDGPDKADLIAKFEKYHECIDKGHIPDDTGSRSNGGVICDMLIGPCACGAWHT